MIAPVSKAPMGGLHELVVYIGRFQPFHTGHMAVVRKALTKGRRVLILVGDSGKVSLRNPIPAQTVQQSIAVSVAHRLPPGVSDRINVALLHDVSAEEGGDLVWVSSVKLKVDHFLGKPAGDGDVAIIGHKKDASSEYLNWFPEYTFIESPVTKVRNDLDISPTSAKIPQILLDPGKPSYAEVVLSSVMIRNAISSRSGEDRTVACSILMSLLCPFTFGDSVSESTVREEVRKYLLDNLDEAPPPKTDASSSSPASQGKKAPDSLQDLLHAPPLMQWALTQDHEDCLEKYHLQRAAGILVMNPFMSDEGQQVFLSITRRDSNSAIGIPGGKASTRESDLSAAVREFCEEVAPELLEDKDSLFSQLVRGDFPFSPAFQPIYVGMVAGETDYWMTTYLMNPRLLTHPVLKERLRLGDRVPSSKDFFVAGEPDKMLVWASYADLTRAEAPKASGYPRLYSPFAEYNQNMFEGLYQFLELDQE